MTTEQKSPFELKHTVRVPREHLGTVDVHPNKETFIQKAAEAAVTPVHMTGEGPYKYEFVDGKGILHVHRGYEVKKSLEQKGIKVEEGHEIKRVPK